MKLILIISALIFCSFATQTDRTYNIKFSEASLIYHTQNLNAIRQIVDASALPHTQVVFIMQAIDSLGREMNPQINEQNKK